LLSIVMVSVILTYVIPRFSELYRDLNVTLPLPTRILIAVADTLQANMIIVLPLVAISIVSLWAWIGTEPGRNVLDRMKLTVPVLGYLWTMFSMAQLSRTLAMLLQGGTPLLSALEVARDSSGTSVISA